MWLLVAAAMATTLAARAVKMLRYPLGYIAPISKAAYRGRFLAARVLKAGVSYGHPLDRTILYMPDTAIYNAAM
jgi:hypothetical protein